MNRVFLFLILSFLLPISLALQDLLPSLPPCGGHFLLFPVVFAFGVMALPLVPALWFSLLAAVLQGLALLQVQSGQAEIGLTLPVVFFLGWAVVLQMASEATRGMRWELHAAGSAMVTFTMLSGQFLALCVKRGGLPADLVVLMRITVPSVAALLLAPALYFFLRHLVPLAPEERNLGTQPGRPSIP
jgi:hypothetical protein